MDPAPATQPPKTYTSNTVITRGGDFQRKSGCRLKGRIDAERQRATRSTTVPFLQVPVGPVPAWSPHLALCVAMPCSLALSLRTGGCSAHLSCLGTYNCAWFMLNKFCVDGWKRRNDWGRSKSRSQFLPASLCCICVNSQWAAVGGASSPAPLMRGLTTAMQANGQSQGLGRHCVFLLMVLHSCDVDQKEQLAVRRAGLNQLRA